MVSFCVRWRCVFICDHFVFLSFFLCFCPEYYICECITDWCDPWLTRKLWSMAHSKAVAEVSKRGFSMTLVTNMVEFCQNYRTIGQKSVINFVIFLSVLKTIIQGFLKALITNIVEFCQNYWSIDQSTAIFHFLSLFVRLWLQLEFVWSWMEQSAPSFAIFKIDLLCQKSADLDV